MSLISQLNAFVTVTVIAGFMPLSAISFFRLVVAKKESEFEKSKQQMGIQSNRSVSEVHTPSKYILPVLFATIICALGAGVIVLVDPTNISDNIILAGPSFGQENYRETVIQSLLVFVYAFLASFIWSAGNIILRIRNSDLQPNVYYNAGLRVVFATIVSISLVFLLDGGSTADSPFLRAGLPAISILAGTFPNSVMLFLMRKYSDIINSQKLNSEILSLDLIEGISLAHRERLEEIGITNAQNLASAGLTKMMVDTPYDARTLIDWIVQAKLLCYVKTDIENVRKVGIRCVFDLLTADKTPESLAALAEAAGVNPVIFANIHAQINADTGILSLHQFYQRLNNSHTGVSEAAAVQPPPQ